MGRFSEVFSTGFNDENTKDFKGNPEGLFSSDNVTSYNSLIKKLILKGRANYNPNKPVDIKVKVIYPPSIKEDISIEDMLELIGTKGFPGYSCSKKAPLAYRCEKGRKLNHQCSLTGFKIYEETGVFRPRFKIAPTCGNEPIGSIQFYPSHFSPIVNGE